MAERESWIAIEREAREQCRAELEVRATTPLTFGAPIAWALYRHRGITDGFSDVHRVGVPVKDAPYTACGVPIPAPVAWMALTPRLAQAMAPCRFCVSEYARALTEAAA